MGELSFDQVGRERESTRVHTDTLVACSYTRHTFSDLGRGHLVGGAYGRAGLAAFFLFWLSALPWDCSLGVC